MRKAAEIEGEAILEVKVLEGKISKRERSVGEDGRGIFKAWKTVKGHLHD